MVCLSSEGTVVAIVRDTICTGSKRQSIINLAPSKSIAIIFAEVGADFHYQPDSFELLIQNNKTGDTVSFYIPYY